jgi:hypothetical protein
MEEISKTQHQIVVQATEFGIEPQKAQNLVGNLPQLQEEREALTSQYNEILLMDIESPETAKIAKEIRLKIRDNRTKGLVVWHKTTKDYFLKAGQFIDAIKRKEEAVNVQMEDNLEQIEKYLELKKQKQKEELQRTRMGIIEKYLEFVPFTDFTTQTDEEFQHIVEYAEKRYNEKMDKIFDEERRLQEEKQRKEHTDKNYYALLPYSLFIDNFSELDFFNLQESQIKVLIEHAVVKKFEVEAEAKEAKQRADEEIERMKKELEAERKRKEKEAEAERKKIQDKLEKERKEKEKLQEELKKRDAEQKAKSSQTAGLDPKLVGDQEILKNIALQLMNINGHIKMLKMDSQDAQTILNGASAYMVKLYEYILNNVEKLQK